IGVGTSIFSTAGSTCSTSATVFSGGRCALAAVFRPETAGASFTDTLTVRDNSLNQSATSTLPLSGAATANAATHFSVTNTPATVGVGVGFNFTVTALDADGD